MKTVTLVNHNVNHIEVHKPGCADIAKSERRGLVNSTWPVKVPDGVTVADAAVADLNAGFGWPESYGPGEPPPWTVANIVVFPCTKGK